MSDGLLTRIVAIRHGETAWNVDTRIQGQLDVPLNDKGRWQASRLADAVAHEGIAAIYSSDLSRALDTALAVARGSGLQVVTEPGLRERAFGVFEGHTFAEIEARWPEEHLRWKRRDVVFGPEGGEVLQAFYARCIETVERIALAHRGETVALVAHGGVMDCLYRAAAKVELRTPRTWQLGNAGINRLLHTDEGFMLVGWGDVSHLEPGLLDESTT